MRGKSLAVLVAVLKQGGVVVVVCSNEGPEIAGEVVTVVASPSSNVVTTGVVALAAEAVRCGSIVLSRLLSVLLALVALDTSSAVAAAETSAGAAAAAKTGGEEEEGAPETTVDESLRICGHVSVARLDATAIAVLCIAREAVL